MKGFYSLHKSQLYHKVLSTTVIMFYIRFSKLHFMCPKEPRKEVLFHLLKQISLPKLPKTNQSDLSSKIFLDKLCVHHLPHASAWRVLTGTTVSLMRKVNFSQLSVPDFTLLSLYFIHFTQNESKLVPGLKIVFIILLPL